MKETIKAKLLEHYRRWSRFMPSFYYPYKVAGGRLYLDISESPMMFARAIGRFEPEKQKAIRAFLPSGGTFIDAGANKGDFTLLAARVAGEEGRVVSIEPAHENHRWLQKTLEINNCKNVTTCELALGDKEGVEELYIGERSGFHSLLPLQSEAGERKTVNVRVRTLDTLLHELGLDDSVDVIKVDVEGAELKVLRGAVDTLSKNTKVTLLIDIHPSRVAPGDVCDFLQDRGFGLYQERSPFTMPVKDHSGLRAVVARRM